MMNLNNDNKNSEDDLEQIEVKESVDTVSIDSSSLEQHNWTEEEVSFHFYRFLNNFIQDAKLLHLVDKHGKDQWQTIAQELSFPDDQKLICLNRWLKLTAFDYVSENMSEKKAYAKQNNESNDHQIQLQPIEPADANEIGVDENS